MLHSQTYSNFSAADREVALKNDRVKARRVRVGNAKPLWCKTNPDRRKQNQLILGGRQLRDMFNKQMTSTAVHTLNVQQETGIELDQHLLLVKYSLHVRKEDEDIRKKRTECRWTLDRLYCYFWNFERFICPDMMHDGSFFLPYYRMFCKNFVSSELAIHDTQTENQRKSFFEVFLSLS